MALLLQTEGGALLGLDDLFWLTVLVVFLVTFLSVLVRRLRRDKCLVLLDDHHVTWLDEDRGALWGDLTVTSRGVELRFDAGHVTSRGLVKSSCLLLEDDVARCHVVTRVLHGLTDDERGARERQVRRTFEPGALRRAVRVAGNWLDMLGDAFSKSLGVFAGAVASRGAAGKALDSRKKDLDVLGEDLKGWLANAYEPLYERAIGRQVVVEITNPKGAASPTSEFPGYLVDYSRQFVAVFNVDVDPVETIELETTDDVSREGLTLDVGDEHFRITASGEDALVVCDLNGWDLGLCLLPGCSLELRRPAGAIRGRIERTRRVDLVAPRSRARIRYGSGAAGEVRPGWTGVAPPEDDEDEPA